VNILGTDQQQLPFLKVSLSRLERLALIAAPSATAARLSLLDLIPTMYQNGLERSAAD
jgi:hypothetical protein